MVCNSNTRLKKWFEHFNIQFCHLDLIKNEYFKSVSQCSLDYWDEFILKPNSKIYKFSAIDYHLMFQIHNDIIRTQRYWKYFNKNSLSNFKRKNDISFDYDGHLRRLERIMYIFACENPKISYLQGFNELLMPLYYCALKELKELDAVEAVAFTFFKKLILNTKLISIYVKKDGCNKLSKTISVFSKLVSKHLPQINKMIKNLKIEPIFYCLKWFSLMFAQNYDLNAILILWDNLFEHLDDLLNYLFFIGLSHLHYLEKEIDENNPSQTIKLLQMCQLDLHIHDIIEFAEEEYINDLNTRNSYFDKMVCIFNLAKEFF